ncbi:hypothetical protein M9H77_35364 [Catharanthus roseus]|uniref:Uncharacterized protein n=1 Tax=Catharanthus roseus TaxID=4058 RepID=A0ACB9ZPQ5_CATRO|nr:hypothetical protein M9H77_35364 [Catharanthus roseus]
MHFDYYFWRKTSFILGILIIIIPNVRKYKLELRNLNSNILDDEIQEKISEGFVEWHRVEGPFKKVRMCTDTLSMGFDVPHQDDVFQGNEGIHEGSAIDVTIKDVGPLVHECRSSKLLDIAVLIYFEEVQNEETEIEWDSNEDSDEETKAYSNAAADNYFDEDSDRWNII